MAAASVYAKPRWKNTEYLESDVEQPTAAALHNVSTSLTDAEAALQSEDGQVQKTWDHNKTTNGPGPTASSTSTPSTEGSLSSDQLESTTTTPAMLEAHNAVGDQPMATWDRPAVFQESNIFTEQLPSSPPQNPPHVDVENSGSKNDRVSQLNNEFESFSAPASDLSNNSQSYGGHTATAGTTMQNSAPPTEQTALSQTAISSATPNIVRTGWSGVNLENPEPLGPSEFFPAPSNMPNLPKL